MPPRSASTPQHRLIAVAIAAAGSDLVTKGIAGALVTARELAPDALVGLMVVHNDQSAFSIAFGPFTWVVNLVLTMAAIALILPINRDLARVDARAPIALGLILGGAFGNLTSMIAAPHGVLDFVAVRTGAGSALAFNVADVAAYVGLAMLLRTVAMIVRAMMEARRPAVAVAPGAPELAEHEIPRAVFHDRGGRRVGGIRPARAVALGGADDADRADRVVSLDDARAARRGAGTRATPPVRPMSHPLREPPPEPPDRL